MPENSFGTIFKITTWGESHGPAIGVVIDGCPAGLKVSASDIQRELDRRKPCQSKITTKREESDDVEILSGVFEGRTTGSPISLMVKNKGQSSDEYLEIKDKYRPGHADFTYNAKYGIRDYRGGGRASARETIGRVAAGAIAKKILKKTCAKRNQETEILAYVKQVYKIKSNISPEKVSFKQIESNIVRCPDAKAAEKMIKEIEKARRSGDSFGGIIECVIRNVPAGLGSPVFSKLDARLAQAMLSIPAVKGFEIGSGFSCAEMKGSEHNDPISVSKNKIRTLTNNAGGIVGGISNGMDIIFRIAFKPTSSISKNQSTITTLGKNTSINIKGRHDPCVIPRAVPIVEAMAALVLADELLVQKTVKS